MTTGVDPIPREARGFQGKRAGVVTRFVAGAVDIGVTALILVIGYVGICVGAFLLPPPGFATPSISAAPAIVIGYVVMTLYLTLTWFTGGRSYGCHLMGLRVVGWRGRRIRLVTALLRAGFLVAFPIGFFWVIISPANRSIQDVVLRTSVVYDWDVRPRIRPHVLDVPDETIE